MARRFAKVLEEEIEEALFYPSDLVNTKTAITLRVGEELWMYTEMRSVEVNSGGYLKIYEYPPTDIYEYKKIQHYSPTLIITC